MTHWNLKEGDPLHLTIACDARLGAPDYLNDHTWEIHLSGGTPPAVSVQTTYGLRAGVMRLFPRFQGKDSWLSDPADFFSPPRITSFFPNFIALAYSPFEGLEVLSEFWVPESQLLTGRFTFTNTRHTKERCMFEWIALLSHLGEGSGMAVVESGINSVLEGKTEGLSPVCIMTGGSRPGSGPYAGLAHEIELGKSGTHQLTWALASLEDSKAGLVLARQTTTRPWDAEVARIELLEDSQNLTISTGDPDWDAALALSLRAANGLFFSAGEKMPHPSFVLTRRPDNGFSRRGDGMDYSHLWNGQTALDVWHMTSLIGIVQPERCAGLVENFIAARRTDGCLDWKPGLAGQRANRLAQPLLADIAWKIHPILEDPDWVAKIYPALLDFVRCWFSPTSDRDQDGFPEWEHPFQTGLDDAPIFHPWMENAQGVDPDVVESPSLAAMLYRECGALAKMAALLERPDDAAWLESRQQVLAAELESSWSETRNSFSYRDAAIQDSPAGETLLKISSTGTFPVMHSLDSPRRLLINFRPRDEMTRQSLLILHGDTPDGPVTEEVTPRNIHWLHGTGRYTSRHHFTRVVEVMARAMLPGDRCEISTVDFTSEDISLLAPLWAGMPDPLRAAQMVENTILKRYLQPFGLPVCPPDRCTGDGTATGGVWLLWNQLVGEGMVAYGYRKEAAEIFTRNMQAVITGLKTDHAFWSAYDAGTGRGQGERNTLNGLAPVGFLLKLLGLVQISPNQVIVDGLNPFSRSITVQYRGTRVDFFGDRTQVSFANGQTMSVQGGGIHEISLS